MIKPLRAVFGPSSLISLIVFQAVVDNRQRKDF